MVTPRVICKTRAPTGEESKFCGGERSGDLGIALAPTDQLSIRGVIRQDILDVPIGGGLSWNGR